MRKKVIVIVLLSLFVVFFGRLIFEAIKWTPVLLQYFFQKEINLKKTQERVNILFLGIGGGKHDGPLLTDTIIYASIDKGQQKVTLISIPRDLWIPDLKAKINTAYAFGEERKKNGGLILAKTIVERIFNQPVDYILRIDFNGFIKAIDMIGGIEVDVERNFEDREYPISGKETDTCGFSGEEFEQRATSSAIFEAFPCRYEHIVFQGGIQHMNGETALKFVRSRHAQGTEGTDFARSKRQEKVIEAFKDKMFSLPTLLNPGKLISLYDVFQDSIHTDMQQNEYDDFVKLAKDLQDAKINSVLFFYTDQYSEDQGIFVNPPTSEIYKNQWVLIPRKGSNDFSEIQKLVDCEINIGNCNITPTP
ncbi:MAG: LCP family protein [Candidatus Levybacteria bacterium]|nr:LCP family protein [Candidatus Levybacteria bacterium]